jgi:Protein of unknown function (DUF3017)
MEFGHRVYATENQRGDHPRAASAELAGTRGDDTPFRRSRLTEEVRHADRGAHPRPDRLSVPASRRAVPFVTATRGGRDGVVGAIPYLAVLACATAGVYIAWNSGSQGGWRGGVIAGSALLAAAVARLVLPARLVSLLASRHRVTDVLTLTVFGAGLLVMGLVLPR